jgi:PadR family transcriptional regulator, regulatory protein AphA
MEKFMSIKYAILGLLHSHDMYGYQIKNLIENDFGLMRTANFGQIYTNLKTLVDVDSIILTEVAPSEKGAPHKKLYSLTDKGREEFRTWIKSAPERPVFLRDPFMMRFIFFGLGEQKDALKLINEQILISEKSLARRKERLSYWSKQNFYSYMAKDLRLSYNEIYVKWLYKVRDLIQKKKTKAKNR